MTDQERLNSIESLLESVHDLVYDNNFLDDSITHKLLVENVWNMFGELELQVACKTRLTFLLYVLLLVCRLAKRK